MATETMERPKSKRKYFTLKQAQELTRAVPKNLTDKQLQKAYVKARDYLHIINSGDRERLAEGGYYASALTATTKGVVPKDMWLQQNLNTTLSELTEERQKRIAKPSTEVKEPWKMTKKQYEKDMRDYWAGTRGTGSTSPSLPEDMSQRFHEYHKGLVEKALKEGKPVPAEVLKDYPELGKKEPTAIVKDVTPKGYGVSGEGKIVSPRIEKKKDETLDEAIAREVGYQIDNGRVKLAEDRDGWKATVTGLTDEKPHVIRAYKKQQVLNEVWKYLNPSYVEAPAKPEPKAETKLETEAKAMGLTKAQIAQAKTEGVTTALGLRRIEKNTRREQKPKKEPRPRKEIAALKAKPTKQSDRAIAIDRALLAKQVVPVNDPRWLQRPNRFDVRGVDTPGSGRIVAGVAYADKGQKRLARKRHKGWRKVRFT